MITHDQFTCKFDPSAVPAFRGSACNQRQLARCFWKKVELGAAISYQKLVEMFNPGVQRMHFTLLYFTFFILLNCPSDLKLTLKAQGAARDQTPY